MKIADVLRKLADTVEQYGSDPSQPDEKIVNPAGMVAVEVDDEDCGCHDEDCECESCTSQQPTDVMVPPMQLKLELLKKAVGVDNIYDDGADGDTEELESDDDSELARMKQLAAIMNASDDEPLED